MPSYGYVLQIEEAGRAVTAADGTRSIVEIWFTTSLFAALLGSQLVTREYKTGAVARARPCSPEDAAGWSRPRRS